MNAYSVHIQTSPIKRPTINLQRNDCSNRFDCRPELLQNCAPLAKSHAFVSNACYSHLTHGSHSQCHGTQYKGFSFIGATLVCISLLLRNGSRMYKKNYVEDWRKPSFQNFRIRSICRFVKSISDGQDDSDGEEKIVTVKNYAEALQTLLTAKDQGEAELRSTFRRLASVMHPDVAGDSEEVAKRFRGLVEAYEDVEKGQGAAELAASKKPRRKYVSTTDQFDGRRRDRCSKGDVILFRLRDADVNRFELDGQQEWALAVISCNDGGLIHGQRLVFEDASTARDRYRSGWLVSADYEDEILIDPMEKVEVLFVCVSPDQSRYKLELPVDTECVFVDSSPEAWGKGMGLSVL
eukprot:TRINITY_DN32419_c0_g1_i1.p1 TRINITY_DN32419_c0_g1~~TRINITY_DN32419_c0_g1_i1.p1  ORF type:complete len:351 (-),score=43.32 TRINITY_DN32419_c0_g1_i1:754-1806(-)